MFLKKFNKDDIYHYDKKRKRKFKYPMVELKNKGKYNDCLISFSPFSSNTASFVLTIYKKLEIVKDNKKYLLFFSQSKK